MKGLAMINSHAVKRLDQAILATGSVSLATCLFLLGSATLNYFQKNEAEVRTAATSQQIQALSGTIEKAKHVRYLAPTQGESTILQSSLDRFAAQNDCSLIEVTSTADEGPYMSHYKKTADGKGWKQKTFQCQAVGSITNVMALLKDVSSISIPVELQSVEITPIDKVGEGESLVSVKFGLQVMRQEASL